MRSDGVRRRKIAALGAALPAFALSLQYLYVLVAPLGGANIRWAASAPTLVWCELFAVQAGVVIGLVAALESSAARIRNLLIVVALYGLLIGFVWHETRDTNVIVGVALLVLVRAGAAAYGGVSLLRFGFSILVFFIFALLFALTVSRTSLPHAGFTADAVAAFNAAGGEEGMFREPHRAVVFCVLYFMLLGVLELARVPGGWLPERDPADLILMEEGLRLRFAPLEVELKEVRNFSDYLGWFSLPLFFFGVLLTGAWFAAFMVLLSLALIFHNWMRVKVVRARKGRLEWLEMKPFGAWKHRYADATDAAKLDTGGIDVAGKPSADEKNNGALVLRGKSESLVIGRELRDPAKGGALARILRAYVDYGTGKDTWNALSSDRDVRMLIGPDAERKMCSPECNSLAPLDAGRGLPQVKLIVS